MVDRFSCFDELPAGYRELLAIAGESSFDLSLEWFKLLSQHGLADSSDVVLYGVSHDSGQRPAAILPLLRKGHEIRALSNYYSSLYLPVCSKECASRDLEVLFRGVRKYENGAVSLDLKPLPYDDASFSSVLSGLNAAGWVSFPYFLFGNWFHRVKEPDYESYFRARPSRVQNTVTRKTRQFFNKHQGRVEIFVGQPRDDLDKVIAAYEKVYRASWKQKEASPGFIEGLIRLCASKGELRLGVAYVNEEPIAAQIWIVSSRRAAIYKLAYDENFSTLSVGSILTHALMRHVIDVDQVLEVDYLTGDDPYKQEWMTERRERWGIIAYNPATINGSVCAGIEFTKRTVKKLLARD